MEIAIKRIYDDYSDTDGYRILVDRLWPRGISKDRAKLQEWDKEIAPSTELRKWFSHKMENFTEFKAQYKTELSCKKEELVRIRKLAKRGKVTLLYGANNTHFNHALVLKEVLEGELF